MSEQDFKNWQDAMKELLILRGLLTEIENRLNKLYDIIDDKMNGVNEKKGD